MLKKLACTANRLAIPRILQEYRPRMTISRRLSTFFCSVSVSEIRSVAAGTGFLFGLAGKTSAPVIVLDTVATTDVYI